MAGGVGLKELDQKLRHSFLAIKQDMIQLKNALNLQLRTSTELKESIKAISAEVVTKDKLNLIKIKLAELSENFKKVWELEKDIKELDDTTIKKAYLEQKTEEINKDLSDIKKSLESLKYDSVTQKQFSSLEEEINNLRDIRDSFVLKGFSKKIESISNEFEDIKRKGFVNKKEIGLLLDDINREFDKVKEDIKDVKKTKSDESAIEDLDHEVDKKLSDLKDSLEKIGEDVKNLKRSKSERSVVDDLDHEVDKKLSDLKDSLERIGEGIKDVKKTKSDKSAIEDLDHEVDKKLSDLKDGLEKSYGKEFKRIRNRLDEIEGNLVDKKSFAKAVSSMERGEEYEEILEAGVGKRAAKRITRRRKRGKRLYGFANFLIVVAFLLLITAVVSFFINRTTWMDRFAMSAVACFVVGILIRIAVVLKK